MSGKAQSERTKVHVKKGDTVYVLSGKDNGKKGKVLKVFPEKSRVLVEGVNMVKKHKKPRRAGEQGGILTQEAPVHSSNLMLICDKCKAPTKVGRKVLDDGQKVRFCKKCSEIIDVIKSPSSK